MNIIHYILMQIADPCPRETKWSQWRIWVPCVLSHIAFFILFLVIFLILIDLLSKLGT